MVKDDTELCRAKSIKISCGCQLLDKADEFDRSGNQRG